MKLANIYCAPNVMRDNQHNCVFYKHDGYVEQFDIKGDNNKNYPMTDEEFNEKFTILSYTFFSGAVGGRNCFEYKGKPADMIKPYPSVFEDRWKFNK